MIYSDTPYSSSAQAAQGLLHFRIQREIFGCSNTELPALPKQAQPFRLARGHRHAAQHVSQQQIHDQQIFFIQFPGHAFQRVGNRFYFALAFRAADLTANILDGAIIQIDQHGQQQRQRGQRSPERQTQRAVELIKARGERLKGEQGYALNGLSQPARGVKNGEAGA